ncbi:DUF7534 family protein [Halegenticoccus tardaugens]|uniref:DUF7534 family protein n=1 Tax=Halegenticoccus tardaugens TaxID=2071624 RepID=UPI00100B9F4A|nr:hypothetical protein [Halegenticoccus tardaugens]
MIRKGIPTYIFTILALDAIGLGLASVLVPDATARMFVVVGVLFLVPVIAYWLVYFGGYERLGVGVGGDDRNEGE